MTRRASEARIVKLYNALDKSVTAVAQRISYSYQGTRDALIRARVIRKRPGQMGIPRRVRRVRT